MFICVNLWQVLASVRRRYLLSGAGSAEVAAGALVGTIGFSSRIQMLRKRTGLPWYCKSQRQLGGMRVRTPAVRPSGRAFDLGMVLHQHAVLQHGDVARLGQFAVSSNCGATRR